MSPKTPIPSPLSPDRVLTIYKASAGSGKTYTLTYEYILALLAIKNPDTGVYRLNHARYAPKGEITNRHRGILAITFTNKATEEMKRRITSRLHDLTRVPPPGEKDAEYAEELCALTGCTRRELAETAESALHQLLHDFHNFNVSTIDAFFQRVLRNFARELDRQGDFEIELSETAVMNAAVDAMLDDFNVYWREKKPLEEWLFNYMKSAVEAGEKADILNRDSNAHRALVKLISTIASESFTPYEEEMKAYLTKEYNPIAVFAKAIDERISRLKKECTEEARTLLRSLDDLPALGGIKDAPYKFLSGKLVSEAPIDIEKLIDYNAKAAAGGAFFKVKASASESVKAETDRVIALCTTLRLRTEELALIKKSLHTLSFLSFAWSYLDRIFSENNLVLLANTNSLISRIIDGSEVPFIYERLGVRLHHFLIDEFQDTSKMQWENLKPLIANSLSERHDNLIIGDVKQSIYRFRNSDPQLLHRQVQEDDFPLYARERGADSKDNTNYRSSVEVVTFNNTLFGRMARLLDAPGYDHVVQAIPKSNADYHGYVHFIPVASEKIDSEIDLSREEKLLKKYPQLPMMATEINRQISQGGYRLRDIAILCDKRDECSRVIEYLLKYHPQIRVLTSEALYLSKSPVVKLVISMLRLIANVQSAHAQPAGNEQYASLADMNLVLSRFEYFASNPELSLTSEEALSMALNHHETVLEAVESILSERPSSLQALIDVIISQRIPPKMRADQLPYLMALQDYVAEYSARGLQTVNAFLKWWDERSSKFSIPLGSDIDAVTVLTIHKAKGLEYKCLHIPFASWKVLKPKYLSASRWIKMPALEGFDPSIMPPALLMSTKKFEDWTQSIFYDEFCEYKKDGISDTTNLTYVAYTRAASELIAYYDPAAGIGETLVECFKMPPTQHEIDALFTIDLAKGFNAETGEYILGEPTVRRNEEKESASDNNAPEPYRPVYNVYPRQDVKVITSVDSILELDPDIDDIPEVEAHRGEEPPHVRRGNMMHEILSNTRRYTDLPAAVALVAASKEYEPEEVKEAGEFLQKAIDMNRDAIARWFRDYDRVLCEQSIYINLDTTMPHTRRPDRIVFLPDGSAEVVDFKFTSEESEEHTEQVQLYMRLLRQMGYTVSGGSLWYPLLPGSPIVKC